MNQSSLFVLVFAALSLLATCQAIPDPWRVKCLRVKCPVLPNCPRVYRDGDCCPICETCKDHPSCPALDCSIGDQIREDSKDPCSCLVCKDPCAKVECPELSGFKIYIEGECCPRAIPNCYDSPPCPKLSCPAEDQVCVNPDDPCSCTVCKDDITQCPDGPFRPCLDEDAHSECETDNDCNDDKICCPGACATECINPNKEPGKGTKEPCGSSICTQEYDPICGSDGKTYGNQCAFKNARCDDSDLKILHNGECLPQNPCAKVKCPELSGFKIYIEGECCPRAIPNCYDAPPCPELSCLAEDQVCENPDDPCSCTVCKDDITQCPDRPFRPCLDEDAHSECETDNDCNDDKICCPGACATECINPNKEPGKGTKEPCGSPICTQEYDPICGSDGKTYGNQCAFKNARCEDSDLKILHNGECLPRNGCPPQPVDLCVFDYIDDECTTEHDCRPGEICCPGRCNMECREPSW